jgi:hypothetical protein
MSDPNFAVRYLETRTEPILVEPVDAVEAMRKAAHNWSRIAYTEHLKGRYPFLFSLAVRINPLNPNASPIIKE